MTLPIDRRGFLAGAIASGTLASVGTLSSAAHAQSTRLKMVLNWRYQGPQSFFFIAQDKGYFKEAGIDLVIDQGDGSGAAVGKVASGAYDVGFGDVNALIQLASQKPEQAPIAVQMLFNTPPFTIAVKKNGPIKTPKDFEGRTIGGPANDGALRLFPAFCKLAGIDINKVKITNMAPNLRENMLQRGQVDGVFGFVNTIRFSARLAKIDAEKEWTFIRYSDYGMDLYSNAIIVSKKLVAERPQVVRSLLSAINRGLIDTIKDPKGSIAYVSRREPLIQAGIEYDRLIATMKDEMNHPEIASKGIGDIDEVRMKKSIDILVDASKLPRTPAVSEIFNGTFLPPVGERPKKII